MLTVELRPGFAAQSDRRRGRRDLDSAIRRNSLDDPARLYNGSPRQSSRRRHPARPPLPIVDSTHATLHPYILLNQWSPIMTNIVIQMGVGLVYHNLCTLLKSLLDKLVKRACIL